MSIQTLDDNVTDWANDAPSLLPRVRRYTTEEGGDWKIAPYCKSGRDDLSSIPYIPENVFSIEFDNGWIWDRICGWRPAYPY